MTESVDIRSERARRYGRRCVLDLSIPEEQFDDMTAFEADALFPLLRGKLTRVRAAILDFGCGCGRFTAAIREVTGAATSLGYSLCQLVAMATQETPTADAFCDGSRR